MKTYETAKVRAMAEIYRDDRIANMVGVTTTTITKAVLGRSLRPLTKAGINQAWVQFLREQLKEAQDSD